MSMKCLHEQKQRLQEVWSGGVASGGCMGNPPTLTIPTWNVVHSSRAALGEEAYTLAQKYISISQPKRTCLHARKMRVQICLQAYLEREAIKAHIRTSIQRFKAANSVHGCFPPAGVVQVSAFHSPRQNTRARVPAAVCDALMALRTLMPSCRQHRSHDTCMCQDFRSASVPAWLQCLCVFE
jgi:hypothetical protein